MNSKDFAEKYANKPIKLIGKIAHSYKLSIDTIIGTCVGWVDYRGEPQEQDGEYECIVIKPADNIDYFGKEVRANDRNWINATNKEIHWKSLIHVFPIRHCIPVLKPIKPVVAYPHICKVCKSPARKIGKKTLCSNDKCKSWKAVRQEAAIIAKLHKDPNINNDGFVICHECKSFARTCITKSAITPFFYINKCMNGHRWECEWRAGYKMKRIDSHGIISIATYFELQSSGKLQENYY
jgi:hypothetical protein